MKYVRATNLTRGRTLGSRIAVADRWWRRLVGLLGRARLDHGAGLLISPCRGVHTFGMSFPLDVALLDRDGAVVARFAALAPNRITGLHRRARHALELPAGTLDGTGTRAGDRVAWQPAAALPARRRARGHTPARQHAPARQHTPARGAGSEPSGERREDETSNGEGDR